VLLSGLCKDVQDCLWLNPLCDRCGKPAPYSSPQIQFGGKETYEPRYHDWHELPRPSLAGVLNAIVVAPADHR